MNEKIFFFFYKEKELLAQWDKRLALKCRLKELQSQYIEDKAELDIIEVSGNINKPFNIRLKQCLNDLSMRIELMKKDLANMN